MKKLILKIILLAFIPVPLFLLLGLRQEKDKIITAKRHLFEQYKGSTQCLITGTSHTMTGINPTLLPMKTLSIAEDSKPVEVDIEIIEQNIDQLLNLKYVIIPVDYFTFYYTGLQEKSTFKYYHHWGLKNGFIKDYHLKRYHAFTCGFQINEHEYVENNDPLMGYRPMFTDLSKVSADSKLTSCNGKVTYWHEYWIDTSCTQKIYTRLEGFISMLQKRNIQTILITMPVCQELYTRFDPVLLKRNNQLIDILTHSTHVKYINLQNNHLLAADSLYKDVDHLNDKGATIATNIIKDSLN